MKLKPAQTRRASGGGWVLFGVDPDASDRKWVERWFPTREKAIAAAARKGWTIEADQWSKVSESALESSGGLS